MQSTPSNTANTIRAVGQTTTATVRTSRKSEEGPKMASYTVKLASPSLHCPSCVSYITELLEDVQARNAPPQIPSPAGRIARLRADVPAALTGAAGRPARLVRIPSSSSVDSAEAAASLRKVKATLGNIEVSLLAHSISFTLSFPETPAEEVTLLQALRGVIQSLVDAGYAVDSIQVRPDHESDVETQTLDLSDLQLSKSPGRDVEEEDEREGHSAVPPPRVPSLLTVRSLVSPLNELEKRRKAIRRRGQWEAHVRACKVCQTSLKGDEELPTPGPDEAALPAVDETEEEPGHEDTATEDVPTKKVLYTIKLVIGGMTCASCVSSIETGLSPLVDEGLLVAPKPSLPGISIDLMGGTASATFYSFPDKVDQQRDRILEAIDDLGFEAEVVSVEAKDEHVPEPSTEPTGETRWKVTFSVGGMTCASCVGNVEASVNNLVEQKVQSTLAQRKGDEGLPIKVASFQVNLMDGSALAELVAQPCAGADLKKKVKGAVEKYAEEMREAIDESGYDTEIVSVEKQVSRQEAARLKQQSRGPKRTVKIEIEGMFCGSCVKKIRKEVQSWTEVFGPDRFFTKKEMWDGFSLAHPIITVTYRSDPSASAEIKGGHKLHLALRDFIARIDSLDPGFSASYVAPPSLAARTREIAQRELKSMALRTFIAGIFAIPTLVIAVIAPSLLDKSSHLRQDLDRPLWGSASKGEIILWIISTPVQFGVGSVFYVGSYHSLKSVWRKGRPWFDRLFRWGNMDVLVALATSIAYFTSMAVLLNDAAHKPDSDESAMSFFDSCVFLNFFILLGRSLESWSKRRTGDAVAQLGGLKPTTALLAHSEDSDDQGSHYEVVPVDMLEVGDIVVIRPGASPPLDCTLHSGTGLMFNEASLTGEDRPVEKKIGEMVFTGTANAGQGAVMGKVAALTDACMIDSILEAVREASGRKASIQRLADKLTGYFVPVIVYLALLVTILWFAIVYGGGVSQEWINSHVEHPTRPGAAAIFCIRFGVSVVVVACPCGIGLAAPAAQMVGLGLASRNGILVNGGGEAFQVASQVSLRRRPLTLLSDKTGTITMGEGARVVDQMFSPQPPGQKETVLAALGMVEELSTHPIAVALLGFVQTFFDPERKDNEPTRPAGVSLVDTQEVSGQGVQASVSVKGRKATLYAGNEALMTRAGLHFPPDGGDELQRHGRSWRMDGSIVIYVAWSWSSSEEGDASIPPSPASLVAVFSIADAIRPEAEEVLGTLRSKYSADIWMLTGDNEVTAQAVARRVGIPSERVMSGLSPQGKQELIDSLRSSSINESDENGGTQCRATRGMGGGMATAERLKGCFGWARRWVHSTRRLLLKRKVDSRARPLVLFIGDGINDSPALAAADVSLAMGSGSTIAHSSADFILLSKQAPLRSIETVLSLAAATTFKIYQNFAWAAVFNLTLIPIAAGVLEPAHFSLGPSWSGLAMALSSSSVVFNALLLNLWRPPKSKS